MRLKLSQSQTKRDATQIGILNPDEALSRERWGVGSVDPEAADASDAATYERLEANARPIPMALKTETHRDVVAFRSKRK